MTTLILLFVDAVILMVLMRLLVKENASLLSSFLAAALGAFGAMVLTSVCAPVGPHAPVVAGLLVSVGVGLGIWLIFNVGLINSIVIGFLFLVVRSFVYFLLASLFNG